MRRDETRGEEKRGDQKTGPLAPLANSSSPRNGSIEIKRVTDRYLELYPKRKAQASSTKIRAKIKARLREGYTADQLCAAIDGNAKSAFHSENGHNSLELIMRSAEKVDSFLERLIKANDPRANLSEQTKRNIRAAEEWLASKGATNAG